MLCPDCSNPLLEDSSTGRYECSKCHAKFKIEGICDRCGNYVEKLAACGTVSFFCNTCNELKSKSRVKKILTKTPPQQ